MSSKGPHPVRMHWRGIGSTRKGKPPLSLQTLINIVTRSKKASVSEREALDAVKVLDQDPKTRFHRYRDAAVVGGTLSPAVRAIGRGVESAVTARGGLGARAVAFGRGAVRTTGGEVARHATEGMLGAGGVKAVQEGVEVGRARKKLVSYMTSPETPKVAAYAGDEPPFVLKVAEPARAIRMSKLEPLPPQKTTKGDDIDIEEGQ